MGIQGNLKTVNMANLLQWLTEEPLTGTLVLKRASLEKRIMFREGKIVLAASNVPREFLTNYISLTGWVRERPGVEGILVAHAADPQGPLGQRLMDAGLLSDEELNRLLLSKVQDTIFEVFGWREGAFEFHEGDLPFEGAQELALETGYVIFEGVRLLDEIDRYREIFPNPYQIMVLTQDIEPESEWESRLLELLRDGQSIAEICEAAYPVDFPTYQTLHKWLEAGWIEKGGEKERPPEDRPAPLHTTDVVLCTHCGLATPSDLPFCETCGYEIGTEELALADEPEAFVPRQGEVIAGRYEVRTAIGHEGVGTTYSAFDRKLKEEVDLKIALPPEGADASILEEFTDEAQRASKITHPSAIPIRDLGRAHGVFYLVTPHVEGTRLSDPDARARLHDDPKVALEVVRQVGEALAAAHARGVFHGDLRPHHIVLTADDTPVVSDFGLAAGLEGLSSDEREELLGLPLYTAPELLERGQRPDARSDIYSLGTLLYHLLAGTPPHPGETAEAIVRNHRTSRHPTPLSEIRKDLPEGLDELVEQTLARVPSGRYGDVVSFLEALAEVEAGVRRKGLRRVVIALVAGLLIASLAVYRLAFWEPPLDPAEIEAILDQAELARQTESYFSPPGENAVELFNKVLKSDPDNAQALDGLAAIEGLFVQRAESAVADGFLEYAKVWKEKAETVAPGSERVVALTALIDAMQREVAEEAERAEAITAHLETARRIASSSELSAPDARRLREALQAVLALEPQHEEATDELAGLANRLRTAASGAEADGRLVVARDLYGELAALARDDRSVARTLAGLDSRIAAQDEEARRSQEVDRLLAEAQQWVGDEQLIEPAGANALETYRQILEIDPGNGKALKGIAQLRDRFLVEAARWDREGDAYRHRDALEKVLVIAPGDQRAQARLDDLSARIADLEEQRRREQSIAQLLSRADALLTGGDLITPPGDNALEVYRLVLAEDSGNAAGQAGVKRVFDALVARARQELEREHFHQARATLAAAEEIVDGDGAVGTLVANAEAGITRLEARRKRDQEVARLLGLADRYVGGSQFFEPQGQNAFEAYREVLELDPASEPAREGVASLARRFRESGEQQLEAGRSGEAVEDLKHARQAWATLPDEAQARAELDVLLARARKAHEEDLIVQDRLAKADRFFRSRQYTLPAGNNALTAYRSVLELRPDNEVALGRIREVRDLFVRRANASEERNQLDTAKRLLEKALLASPDDAILSQRVADLERRLQARAPAPPPSPAVTTTAATPTAPPPDPAAGTGAGKGPSITVRPPPRQLPQPVDRTKPLLARADDHLAKGQLVEPASGNAAALYREVLRIDPDNERAQAGMDEVRRRLVATARALEGRGDLAGAERTLRRALEIGPGDSEARTALARVEQVVESRRRLESLLASAASAMAGGDLAAATRFYGEASRLEGGAAQAQAGLAQVFRSYLVEGDRLAGEGELERAQTSYRSAARLSPSNGDVRGRLDAIAKRIEQREAEERAEEEAFTPAFSF